MAALIAAEVNMGVRTLPNWLPYAILFAVATGVLLWLGRSEVRVTTGADDTELCVRAFQHLLEQLATEVQTT